MASRGLDCVHGLAMDAKPDAHGVTHARTAMKTAPTQAAIVHFNPSDFDTTTDAGRAAAFEAFSIAYDRALEDLAEGRNLVDVQCAFDAADIVDQTTHRAESDDAIDAHHAHITAQANAISQSLHTMNGDAVPFRTIQEPASPAHLASTFVLTLAVPTHLTRDPREVALALDKSALARASAEVWLCDPESFERVGPVGFFNDDEDRWAFTVSDDGTVFVRGEGSRIYLRLRLHASVRAHDIGRTDTHGGWEVLSTGCL